MLVEDFAPEYRKLHQQIKQQEVKIGLEAQKVMSKYSNGQELTITREINVSSSDSALFKDLYVLLSEREQIQSLIGYDESILKQLKVGEFVEIEGVFKQSPVELVLSSFTDTIQKFAPVMQLAATNDNEKRDIEQVDGISKLLNLEKTTIIIEPEDEAAKDYKFFTTLKSDLFVDDKYEVEGELRIFGKVRKILLPHQTVDLIKLLPGRLRFPKEQLMSMVPKDSPDNSFFLNVDQITEESFTIKGPAIEISPIAIYS